MYILKLFLYPFAHLFKLSSNVDVCLRRNNVILWASLRCDLMSCHKHIIPKWNARRSVLHSPKTRLYLYYLSMFNSWSACHHHGWNTTVTNTRHFNDLFNTNHHDKRTQRWAPFHPWNRATYSDARQKSRSYIVTIERRRWVANNVDLYMYMV